MTIAEKINWTFEHLQSKQFGNQTFKDIKEAYIEYCKVNNIEIEAYKIDTDLKGCLKRLETDGYVQVFNFSIDGSEPTYRPSVMTILDKPKYYERTQEEIDREKFVIESKRKIDRGIKRVERRKKAKEVFIKYWFAIVTGVIVAVIGFIIEKYFYGK